MPRMLPALVFAGALTLLTTACAAEPAAPPSVDLDAAREWVEQLQLSESDGPGRAGSATMIIGPAAAGEPADVESGSVRLEFPSPITLKRGDAACYGGGTAELAITVFTDAGTTSDTVSIEIPCDEELHAVPAGPDVSVSDVSAVMIEGRAEITTYLYAAFIEELVISTE